MKLNFDSIAFKTTRNIAIFSFAFTLFVVFVVKNLFTDSYMQLEKDKVVLISNQIAPALSLNLSYDFQNAIKEIGKKALLNKNILLIKIESPKKKELYRFSNANFTLKDYIHKHELIHEEELKDPGTLSTIAKLTIVYSKASYEKYMNSFNIWFLSGIFIFMFSLLLLSYFLFRSLKNLSILDEKLKNFNPEDPKQIAITTNKNDEISSITRSANIMIRNIVTYFSELKELTSQLLLTQAHLKDAQRMAKVGSLDYDIVKDKLILSDEYYRILGVNAHTHFSWIDFLTLVSNEDYLRVKETLDNAIKNGSQFSLSYTLVLEDNKKIHIETKGKVRSKKDGFHKLTAISMDVTQDVENKKTIEKLAYFDALTGLANRTLLKDRMLKAMQIAKRNEEKLAVIFLDLDHFKLINDTLGHSVGDELLIHVSNLLKTQIRSSDTLARLGGDEFVIFLPAVTSSSDVENLANKIKNSLDYKHTIGTHQLYVTSSIGAAVFPKDGDTCDELIRNADAAMYEAKENGRNRYKMYSQQMGDFVDKQLNLEQDLVEAVKSKEQIEVYYQVKTDANSKKVIGAEALVRWNHPTRGLVFPDDFIYMAESTGLMVELGKIITDQSIKMIKELNDLNIPNFKMAINLSARQFQDDNLISDIEKTLSKYNVDSSEVEFEITESLSMANMNNTLRILNRLRDIGVTIAIDDFGTGHSSLAYLKKFPINTLKIDKSFVTDITENEDDKVIAQTIISMAHSLGFKTVAEGVETQEHVDMLQNMGCDILQGYFYSKAITKEAFLEYVKKYNK